MRGTDAMDNKSGVVDIYKVAPNDQSLALLIFALGDDFLKLVYLSLISDRCENKIPHRDGMFWNKTQPLLVITQLRTLIVAGNVVLRRLSVQKKNKQTKQA